MTIRPRAGPRIVAVISVLVVTACSSVAPPSPSPSDGNGTPSPTSETAGPTTEPTVVPSSTTQPTAQPTAIGPDRAVTTVVDRLRVRSLPSVGAESDRYEPVLATGTDLYILGGPIVADGYEWFEVVALRSWPVAPLTGWVAGASRDGVPWLALTDVDCPSPPTTVDGVRDVPLGLRLACLSGVPVSFEALITWCNCDLDGPDLDPDAFDIRYGNEGHLVLIAPEHSTRPDRMDLGVLLRAVGAIRDPLPEDRVVRVTGVFDHPSARGCTSSFDDQTHDATQDCRVQFVVTDLRAAGD